MSTGGTKAQRRRKHTRMVDNKCNNTKHVHIVSRGPKLSKSKSPEDGRGNRIAVWSVLIAICRKIEHLQASTGAKKACREVSERLAEILAGEQAAARSKRD
jgi:hypothetical protein